MIIDFGDNHKLDLGSTEKLSVTFPLNLFGKTMGLRQSITMLPKDDFLSCYGCGDMLNSNSDMIAGSSCTKSPVHQITLELQIQIDGEEPNEDGTIKVEHTTCYAVACEEHCIAVANQLLFLSGVFLGMKVGAEFDGDDDDMLPNDDV